MDYKTKAANLRTRLWVEEQKRVNPNYIDDFNSRHRLRQKTNRLKVISHYTKGKMTCMCCNENQILFLEIDHMDNNGNKQRNIKIEDWIIKNNYPNNFQILCSNCNKGKHLNYGTCPHENA